MTSDQLVTEIKGDLGGDVLTLGIKDTTIAAKITEALRYITPYAPKVVTGVFESTGERIVMPEDTVNVIGVLSVRDANNGDHVGDDQVDIFSVNNYVLYQNPDFDPMSYLMKTNELQSTLNFIDRTDWYYVKDDHTLYLNYYNRPKATVKYLKKYSSVEDITDDTVLEYVKLYALALCKIIEGGIRRKLSQAPGAIQMDGDTLAQEGITDKQNLEEKIPKIVGNLKYGVRA